LFIDKFRNVVAVLSTTSSLSLEATTAKFDRNCSTSHHLWWCIWAWLCGRQAAWKMCIYRYAEDHVL